MSTAQAELALPASTTWSQPKGGLKRVCGRDLAAGPRHLLVLVGRLSEGREARLLPPLAQPATQERGGCGMTFQAWDEPVDGAWKPAEPSSDVLCDCPFCGAQLLHIESEARSFDPPRTYHEFHHPKNGCPILDGKHWHFTDDVSQFAAFIAGWNTRTPGDA